MPAYPRRGRVATYQGRPVLPLDDRRLADPIGAFSLRLLRTGYAGPCVRVRRGVDQFESDIGFGSDGFIDQVALLALCGTQPGIVSVKYDQGLRGNHMRQPTAAKQLRIVTSSAVELTTTGKPCLVNRSGTGQGYIGDVQPGYTGKGASFSAVCMFPTGGSSCRFGSFVKGTGADNGSATSGAMMIQNSTVAQAGIFRSGSAGYSAIILDRLLAMASRTTGGQSQTRSSVAVTTVFGASGWDVDRMLLGVNAGDNVGASIVIGANSCEEIGWWRDVGSSALDDLQANQRAAWGAT